MRCIRVAVSLRGILRMAGHIRTDGGERTWRRPIVRRSLEAKGRRLSEETISEVYYMTGMYSDYTELQVQRSV